MHSKRGLTEVFVLFAIAILGGCGGGGSDNGSGTPAGGGPGTPPPTLNRPPQSGSPSPSTFASGFAFVAHRAENNISAFAIDSSTGLLAEVAGSPFAATEPIRIVADPAGKFVYVATGSNSTFNDTVATFSIDANGALTNVGSAPAVRSTVQSISVTPNGRFVYTTSGGSPASSFAIDAFTVDAATGQLTPADGNPFFAGRNPSCIAADPSSSFAYVTNQAAHSISQFTIDGATGALTPIPVVGTTQPIGAPQCLTVGKFVYVAQTGGISAYSIDSTGELRDIPGSPFAPNGFFSITTDPAGRFVYASNSSGIFAYAISATGTLSQVAGSPFGTAASIVIDPSGKFAYAASTDITGFAIDASTGALTEIGTLPAVGGSIATTRVIQ